MRIHYLALLGWMILAGPAIANDAPASDESIRQLLAITEARKLLDSMKLQVDAMTKTSVQQAMQGKTVTPERQAILDRMHSKMDAVLNEMLSWDTLEPIYVRTYRESFTQDELDGITAFYKTTAGQALIKKTPVVMQNVMAEVQGLMRPSLEKIQQIQKETQHELNDLPAKPQ